MTVAENDLLRHAKITSVDPAMQLPKVSHASLGMVSAMRALDFQKKYGIVNDHQRRGGGSKRGEFVDNTIDPSTI